jgi:glucarate dehydratase
MLHLGAVLPNLSFSADAHYHHLVDDIIVGGKMKYQNGKIRVPDGPGLGVSLDQEKLKHYAELYKELGGYQYDRDPGRPGWFPLVPNDKWADPTAKKKYLTI